MELKASMDSIVASKVDTTGIIDPVVRYELKVPFIQTDDYGNEVILYRKEIIDVNVLLAQKQNLVDQIAAIDAKLDPINAIK